MAKVDNFGTLAYVNSNGVRSHLWYEPDRRALRVCPLGGTSPQCVVVMYSGGEVEIRCLSSCMTSESLRVSTCGVQLFVACNGVSVFIVREEDRCVIFRVHSMFSVDRREVPLGVAAGVWVCNSASVAVVVTRSGDVEVEEGGRMSAPFGNIPSGVRDHLAKLLSTTGEGSAPVVLIGHAPAGVPGTDSDKADADTGPALVCVCLMGGKGVVFGQGCVTTLDRVPGGWNDPQTGALVLEGESGVGVLTFNAQTQMYEVASCPKDACLAPPPPDPHCGMGCVVDGVCGTEGDTRLVLECGPPLDIQVSQAPLSGHGVSGTSGVARPSGPVPVVQQTQGIHSLTDLDVDTPLPPPLCGAVGVLRRVVGSGPQTLTVSDLDVAQCLKDLGGEGYGPEGWRVVPGLSVSHSRLLFSMSYSPDEAQGQQGTGTGRQVTLPSLDVSIGDATLELPYIPEVVASTPLLSGSLCIPPALGLSLPMVKALLGPVLMGECPSAETLTSMEPLELSAAQRLAKVCGLVLLSACLGQE
ncbi:hypothetical protein KIPB_006096 [Kipferlia bialata]|uniref:Uncharacterized protein n=1 Tax=Kipferlia bialata TaxID=797122 RepID=A0A9K3CZN5_9EUKA|nr:hypothetical protein KIPB_006096 [Kipferlia bialata]|eukprot:g6096.t1